MNWELVGTWAITICLILGALFTFVGAIGLLKFNDGMTRLHAPTKVGTVGIGSLLLASILHSFLFGDGALHEVLIMAFLFVTAPISANFIAKVNIHRRSCDTPPDLPEGELWATYDVPETDDAREVPARPDSAQLPHGS